MKNLVYALFICGIGACIAEEPADDGTPVADEIAVDTSALEPAPCSGRREDSGTGGDYYDGITIDHLWSRRLIYGTWYNCGGVAGQADRVRIDVATDTDGPCITVPYRSDGSSVFIRKYKLIPSTFRGWYRC